MQGNLPFPKDASISFLKSGFKKLTDFQVSCVINRQCGIDALSNPVPCVSRHQSTTVSHVMLILSETNPIICVVSEPDSKKHWGGFSLAFPSSLSPSQGLPIFCIMLSQGATRITKGTVVHPDTLWRRENQMLKDWAQIWADRCELWLGPL